MANPFSGLFLGDWGQDPLDQRVGNTGALHAGAALLDTHGKTGGQLLADAVRGYVGGRGVERKAAFDEAEKRSNAQYRQALGQKALADAIAEARKQEMQAYEMQRRQWLVSNYKEKDRSKWSPEPAAPAWMVGGRGGAPDFGSIYGQQGPGGQPQMPGMGAPGAAPQQMGALGGPGPQALGAGGPPAGIPGQGGPIGGPVGSPSQPGLQNGATGTPGALPGVSPSGNTPQAAPPGLSTGGAPGLSTGGSPQTVGPQGALFEDGAPPGTDPLRPQGAPQNAASGPSPLDDYNDWAQLHQMLAIGGMLKPGETEAFKAHAPREVAGMIDVPGKGMYPSAGPGKYYDMADGRIKEVPGWIGIESRDQGAVKLAQSRAEAQAKLEAARATAAATATGTREGSWVTIYGPDGAPEQVPGWVADRLRQQGINPTKDLAPAQKAAASAGGQIIKKESTDPNQPAEYVSGATLVGAPGADRLASTPTGMTPNQEAERARQKAHQDMLRAFQGQGLAGFAKRNEVLQEATLAAQRSQIAVDAARRDVGNTGKLAPLLSEVGSWASAMGLAPDKVKRYTSSVEGLRALFNDAIIKNSVLLKGSISNADMDRLDKTYATISGTPQGNMFILDFITEVNRRTQRRAEMYALGVDAVGENQAKYSEVEAEIARRLNVNPLDDPSSAMYKYGQRK